jgi:hypothetical protein
MISEKGSLMRSQRMWRSMADQSEVFIKQTLPIQKKEKDIGLFMIVSEILRCISNFFHLKICGIKIEQNRHLIGRTSIFEKLY